MTNDEDPIWFGELNYHLRLDEYITSSGATLTAPAATDDLRDWVGDTRTFLSVQYDDWLTALIESPQVCSVKFST